MRVSDVGGRSTEIEVEVEIHSVHKRPEILNLPRRIAISEDVLPGMIFTLRTVDEDHDDDDVEVYFRVLEGDPELFGLQGASHNCPASSPVKQARTMPQGRIPVKQARTTP